jgi:hypothetical protein
VIKPRVRRKSKKPVRVINDKYRVMSARQLSWAGAPCSGFLSLTRPGPIAGEKLHADIPWDDSWVPGSIVEVEVKVTLVKAVPKSRKRCHNPWPAHVHDDVKAKRARR